MKPASLRIGIDVGGTFTDIVAVDASTRQLVAALKVPTSHDDADGVAAGIVLGLRRLLDEHAIDPTSIAFIAHSTTQATNALLEGDVARVGVVTYGGAFGRMFARFAPFSLAEGVSFAPQWFDGRDPRVLERLAEAGIEAVAASAPFGVDRPARENALVSAARAQGIAATGGAEVSTQYGLRARTRTAALNAAILPRMLRTSRVTARAVADASIPAPLMIMRSDGGVMDVSEVERRPILTMLSGPAAGIAGALFHENVTDGIFIEVGGTSADMSVIRRGQPQMRPARIGGHRTLLRTLDVRTIAVAGGSLANVRERRVTGVGPRSAHIAGYRYAAFTPSEELIDAQPALESGYAALRTAAGVNVAITPTCAANALGVIPADAFAMGDAGAARAACELVGAALGMTGDALAHAILDAATSRLRATIDELIVDYGLDRATTTLVGGGGGAAALLPYAAERLGFAYRIARDAHVISPLGVALALVRDVVERTIVDPTSADLARIRREAIDAAVAAGADAAGVEVTVEVDSATNRVRATASGATTLTDTSAVQQRVADEAERLAAAVLHVRGDAHQVHETARTSVLRVFAGPRDLAIVDERAVVRLTLADAFAETIAAGALERRLPTLIEEHTAFGDVGRAVPDIFILHGRRIAEFTGMGEAAQILALASEELSGVAEDDRIVIVAARKRA